MYEYVRRGSGNGFMACEPLAGWCMVRVTERRTRADWAHFGRAIAGAYPDAERITLVMDNLNTHSAGSLYEAFPPEEADWPVSETAYRLHRNRACRSGCLAAPSQPPRHPGQLAVHYPGCPDQAAPALSVH